MQTAPQTVPVRTYLLLAALPSAMLPLISRGNEQRKHKHAHTSISSVRRYLSRINWSWQLRRVTRPRKKRQLFFSVRDIRKMDLWTLRKYKSIQVNVKRACARLALLSSLRCPSVSPHLSSHTHYSSSPFPLIIFLCSSFIPRKRKRQARSSPLKRQTNARNDPLPHQSHGKQPKKRTVSLGGLGRRTLVPRNPFYTWTTFRIETLRGLDLVEICPWADDDKMKEGVNFWERSLRRRFMRSRIRLKDFQFQVIRHQFSQNYSFLEINFPTLRTSSHPFQIPTRKISPAGTFKHQSVCSTVQRRTPLPCQPFHGSPPNQQSMTLL
jgi:hypothetical protein